VPHDTRDSVIDFVRNWSDKTEIPNRRFIGWLGIAKSKFYQWQLRHGKVNEHHAWVPRDHWLTEAEKTAILGFHDQFPLEGYRRLTFMMLDRDIVACSPASVYRVLSKAGRLQRWNRKPSKKGTGFVQPLVPHQHWHVDVTQVNVAGSFFFLCSLLDGCSRFIVHWEIHPAMPNGTIQTIIQRARERFPGEHPRIISDNGPQFLAKDFKEFIRVCGLSHVRTSPYYPQSNGKLERWHKTLKEDCIRTGTPVSLDDARALIARWIEHYNNVRLHSALGYVAPLDKLQGRQQEIFNARDCKLAMARERRKQQRAQSRLRSEAHPAIDFKVLREQISMAEVLELLRFTPTSSRGSQQRGPCPLHGSTSTRSRCFSVDLDSSCFQCFKCNVVGNALDLYAQATQQSLYIAALDLCNRLNRPVPRLAATPAEPQRTREEEPVVAGS
jgi:putative transposase